LIISLIIIVIIIGAVFFLFVPEKAAAAILYIDEGTVEINTGSGWKAASDEMELKENTEIRTAEGRATVVLYDSEILRLEPDTHIKLKDLNKENIVVRQETGGTWNKIMKMTGTEGYEVETPDTVATVRGTEFGVLIAGALSEVFVEAGNMNVAQKGDDKILGEIGLTKGESVEVKKGIRELVKSELKEKHLEMIRRNKAEDLKTMRKIRKNIVMRNKLARLGMKIKKFTEKNLDDSLDDLDSGRAGQEKANELIDKIPGYSEEKERFKELNRKIREKVKAGQVPQELKGRLAAVKVRTGEEVQERQELKERMEDVLDQGKQVKEKLEATAEKIRDAPEKVREEIQELREPEEEGQKQELERQDQTAINEETDNTGTIDDGTADSREQIQIQREPLR
ncbi:hypothetical protein GF371_00750, partial [Candidatus Woesearchaeota archaeon]|nr:hypothetical protein [Candidatus Woesearchaeota archaeon]